MLLGCVSVNVCGRTCTLFHTWKVNIVTRKNTLLWSRFADKPKKGLRFLQEKGLVGSKPEDVAKFFFNDERLDKVFCIYMYSFFFSFFLSVSLSGSLFVIILKIGSFPFFLLCIDCCRRLSG